MKKIFTLVILIVSIQTLFAQRDTTRRNRRDTTNWQGRRMAGDTSIRRSDSSFRRSDTTTQSRQRRNVNRDSSSTRNITPAPATQTRIVTGTNDTTHGSVQGRLMDTINKQIISQASLSLINTRDSSIAARGLSGPDGSFNIGEVPFGNYSLRIGFQGYDNITRAFTVRADSPLVNLGNIYMYLQANQLLDVVVTASPRPIIIRKDTVEFNAANITVKPNGNVEDLLNKIPGVETDKDGNVKAQGEQVQRILVDGKRFFGDDPKMATRNLPPDVVDKIQVFDAQSDQSAFSGFDDGERVKTINIITKKDKRQGYFGKGVLGVGDQGRFENSLSLSHFNGNQQISLIGQANNTNRQGFTIQDQLGSFNGGGGRGGNGGAGGGGNSGGGGNRGGGGGSGNFGGGGNRGTGGGGASFSTGGSGGGNNSGIVTTLAGGLNYRDVWSPKTEAYGSYFYNNLKVNKDQHSVTQQLLQNDSSLFSDQVQQSLNKNQNHRFTFNIEQLFDSSNSLIIRPNFSYQKTDFTSTQQTTTTREHITNVSNSLATSNRQNEGINGSADVTFRHRFAKKGRTYSIRLNGGINTNNGEGENFSVNNSYNTAGTTFKKTTINQLYNQTSDGKNFNGTFSYTEPISNNQQIELNYNYGYTLSTSDRKTYNYDSATKGYTALDTALSNAFQNIYNSNRFTLNYRIQSKNYNLIIGSGIQFANQNSDNSTRHINIKRNYTNLYPAVTYTYNFSNTKNLRVFYTGRTNQPSVNQLQPVTDYSDPLNIQRGNPALAQEFTHSLRFLYTSFNTATQRNVFASINGTMTNNKISNSITTVLPESALPPDVPANTPAGAQIITPVNLNGFYNINAYLGFGFPIKNPKSNLNFSTNFSHNQTVNVQNNTKALTPVTNYNRNYTIGQTVRYTTNLKKGFDLNFSTTSTYTMARYTIQPTQNTNFFSEILFVDATGYTTTGWILSSDFSYTYNSGRVAGFNTSIPLWNASVAKQFLKDKAGELRFSVFDIMNQNVSIQRNVSENYIQDVQTKVLTRYFLLTFTYNLRQFNQAPQQQRRGNFGGPGGGMDRGMRGNGRNF